MFFRPKFCAHCGEKIDRLEWFPWTSRRFCQVCETEFKGQDLVIRGIFCLAILGGIFGFGSYLKSDGSPATRLVSKVQGSDPIARELPKKQLIASEGPLPDQRAAAITGQLPEAAKPSTSEARPLSGPERPKTPIVESSNYCGAETRKGTPCSRKVKGKVRCFQHTGMPSMKEIKDGLTAERR